MIPISASPSVFQTFNPEVNKPPRREKNARKHYGAAGCFYWPGFPPTIPLRVYARAMRLGSG